MSDQSRRKLLKSLAAGSGAVVTAKSLPESWSRPVVDGVMLPAHAQTTVCQNAWSGQVTFDTATRWEVYEGVCSVDVVASGAGGGSGGQESSSGGSGGPSTGLLSVVPGEILVVTVGTAGGYGGSVRQTPVVQVVSRVVVRAVMP